MSNSTRPTTIATHVTNSYEAVAYIGDVETDQKTGEGVTNLVVHFHLLRDNVGNTSKMTFGLGGEDQRERALDQIASMDGDRFKAIYRDQVAPYFALADAQEETD